MHCKRGGIGGCCVLGYHTYFTDGGSPTENRWAFAFASWITPGIWQAGFADITPLSHEVAETYNNPFVNNSVSPWQYPNEPGVCQGNLETGDPVAVLQSPLVSVPIQSYGSSYTYHPQTEALLQWFGSNPVSNALGGAFSYPDNTALTAPATPCH